MQFFVPHGRHAVSCYATKTLLDCVLQLLHSISSIAVVHSLIALYTRAVISYLRKVCKNKMLRMRCHVSAGFFRCDVLVLQGKHNSFRHIVARVPKVNF